MHEPKGHPLRLDPDAVSANPEHPPFVARPPGAPVFHGFPVLEDVEVEGFKLGMISDWEAEPSDYGDAFVVAPDGSRAGLMWVFDDQRRVREVRRSEPDRWGVWEVGFPHPMRTREDARLNLAYVLPDLLPKWKKWCATRSTVRFKLFHHLRELPQRFGDWRYNRRST